jgi:hypothetical protein
MSDTVASESTIVETPASVETPAVETPAVETPAAPEKPSGLDALKEKIEKTTVDPVKADPAAVTPAAAFKANYKFKVMDKDHEIPEQYRALMKDAKTEKEVREVFEKAMGLDFVKPKLEATREQLQQSRGETQGWVQSHNSLKQAYSRNDFDSFFQQLQVPQEKVFQWVLDKVNYNQLPPEQRAIIDQQKNSDQRAFALENAMRGQQESFLESSRQAKTAALESCLTRPDTKAVNDAFNERVGKPGAFENAIRQHAHTVYVNSQGKRDLSPDQAIKEVMDLYGISATAAAPAAAVVQPSAQEKPPVIPNIPGRQSVSPVKSKMRSIEDLIARRKELENAG